MDPLEGKDVLSALLEARKYIKGHWWVSAGTLLGLHRDKKFIPHDTDIDLCMLGNQTFELPKEFTVIRTVEDDYNGREYQSAYIHAPTGVIVDINHYHPDEMVDDLYITKREENEYRTTPKKLVHPLGTITHKRFKFPAPNDIPSYLKMWYGDWTIPQPGGKTEWQKP